MAMRGARICGCGHVTPYGVKCACAIKRDKERKDAFDQTRPSASARGYGRKWEEARNDFLSAYPCCIRCGAKASVVDHIIPHKGDMKLFWRRSNWQSLCATCHNIWKQSQEKRS